MKPKGDIYPQRLDWNDPEFLKKSSVNDSINYLHDQTRKDKDRLITVFFFVSSLGLTLLATIFEELVKTAIIFLILILIISIFDYKKKRYKFWKNRDVMKKTAETVGLEWKET